MSTSAKESLRDVLAALPAVSALTLAALYGLGVLLNVTQLLGAQVPVQDALPLIPLQDHLTKGLGAVFTSVALFVYGVGLFFGMLFMYAAIRSIDKKHDAIESSSNAAEAIDDALVRETQERRPGLEVELDALQDESHALQADLHAFTKEWERAKDARELAVAEVEHRMEELKRRSEESARRTKELKRRTDTASAAINRAIRLTDRLARALGAAMVLFALFVPPISAGALVVLGVLCRLGRRLASEYPLALYALVLLASTLPWGIDAYVHPAPLPRAVITTDTGIVRGSLITSNANRYVITTQRDAFRAIPVTRVRSVTVVRPDRSKQKSLFRLVFD